MLDRVPLPSWAADRVALLGDAVHPMPAYLAQGACQAIEDAAALADVLADCPGPHDVAAALAGYQARRAPRAIRVSRARQVWESGPLPRRPGRRLRGERLAVRAVGAVTVSFPSANGGTRQS